MSSTARLTLVRHGAASAKWAEALDPGLSPVGIEQAAAVARCLAPLGPLPIITSPLARTRQTAVPLEARWNTDAVVEPRVGEIPSPPIPMEERGAWLRTFMAGGWSQAEPALIAWRSTLLEALAERVEDAVIFTHFVVINAIIGAATGDDRVVCRILANCSVTTVDVSGGGLHLVEMGEEAAGTVVQPGAVEGS